MLWWSLPIPYKIRIFMWLLAKNKILTKVKLQSKGWQGNTQCHFCSGVEDVNHLFLLYPFVQKIWFWMGHSSYFYKDWTSIQDIINFASRLSKAHQTAFLVMFSAFCWTVWKIRNDRCFNAVTHHTFRTVILLIISLLHYWTGILKKHTRELIPYWLPYDVDAIPLQVWVPEDLHIVLYQGQGQELMVTPDPEEEDEAPTL